MFTALSFPRAAGLPAQPVLAAAAARAALRPADPAPDPTRDSVPRGCGWFDSSHELHRGLAVRELDAADLLALPGGLGFLCA